MVEGGIIMAQTFTLTLSGIALGFMGFYLFNDAKQKHVSRPSNMYMTTTDNIVQNFLSEISSLSATNEALETAIKGLPNSEYANVRPIAYRPFLAKAHLSMGMLAALVS